MYKLSNIKIKNLEYLDIENSDSISKLRLCLNQGGRIDFLKFDNIKIISKNESSTYKDSYASAILFPFVNRIKNGKY